MRLVVSFVVWASLFVPLCAAQQKVPVREVVLFTSGVGYFEHGGSVSGDGTTELRFTTEQINDVLKSLLVQDLGGGRVEAVVYPSQDPLERTLRSFDVDLTRSPSLGDLLNQLRGSGVVLHVGGQVFTGTILSVETREILTGGAAVETWVLNLLTSGGIRTIPLSEAERIELADPELREELEKALAAFVQSRDQDQKPVTIQFGGRGTRRVRIGYVVEAPVWKASYRLILPEPGSRQGYVQGWAIVENQTEMDWDGVELSLVSGRPISFVQNLYQPLYVQRPVVQSELREGIRPQVYEEGVRLSEAEVLQGVGEGPLSGTVRDAETGEPLPGVNIVVEGATVGGTTDIDGRYRIPGAPPGRHVVVASYVGYAQARQSVQIGGRSVTINFALYPQNVGLDEVVVAAAPANAGYAARGVMADGEAGTLDPTASVVAQGSAGEAGELFQYTVPDVSLPRQRSAMIPIVTGNIEAERVSIFNPSVLATHPLRGARLVNTTGLHLASGPVTVLDDGSYAGDARVGDFPPGEERFISFAVDHDMDVDVADEGDARLVQTARIVDGVLEITRKHRHRLVYTVENEGDRDKMLIVEHARRPGWELVDTPAPLSSTPEVHRFRVAVGTGETVPFTVVEENVVDQRVSLANTGPDQLVYYVQSEDLPADVRRALQRAIDLGRTLARIEEQIQDRERQLAAIANEQARIRENMKTVEAGNDYYRRLLSKLEEQEDQIERLQQEIASLRQEHQAREDDLRRYLLDLDVR